MNANTSLLASNKCANGIKFAFICAGPVLVVCIIIAANIARMYTGSFPNLSASGSKSRAWPSVKVSTQNRVTLAGAPDYTRCEGA